jgi:bifunctional UDP-N-acetylglucosamine pyrophosphorylase/glucosamine-1-phosphate N-acetyltransferase
MPIENLEVIILAAGLGKRMKSATIKVLHRAGGRPLIDYVLDLATELGGRLPILVVGHQRDAVQAHCQGRARFVVQEEQLGTGHAVLQAAPLLESEPLAGRRVLVLSGDVPLTLEATLRHLVEEHERAHNGATLLSMKLEDPALYGRIVREADGSVRRIVEAKDATPEILSLNEVNAGIYVFEAANLFAHLRALGTDNAQGEYYLTDVVAKLRDEGKRVGAIVAADPVEALGVNSRADLAEVEAVLNRRAIARLMDAGVTFRNPAATTVDTTVVIGADSVVYPYVCIEGSTSIGRGCTIYPGVHLKNVRVGDEVEIKTGTVAEDTVIEARAAVGPYSHLRAGTVLGPRVKVGNFVETKKAVFGAGAKASHLSYIGDARIGSDVNIGAGTITCNYDGVRKNTTVIEDGAFIGSDSQLVAPVTIGHGAYVGAGSTITRDVPPDSLALTRAPRKTIEGWAAKRREEQKKK